MTTATVEQPKTLLFILHVTKEDIDKVLEKNKNARYALINAFQRTFPQAFQIYIMGPEGDMRALTSDIWDISIHTMSGTMSFRVPFEIVHTIQDFQKTGEMSPLSWEIYL